jgi:hypothetical protein
VATKVRMKDCWYCGGSFPAEQITRHEVRRTSTSGGRSGVRVSTRTQRVNLCPECLTKHQRKDNVMGVLGAIFLAVIVGGLVWLYFIH